MLGDYQVYVQIVEAGSLTEAGRRLRLSPAMVSKRLARLEERLNAQLIHRTTRRLAMTAAGQQFYERVVAILAASSEAEALVKGEADAPRGLLRVSAPTSFGRVHIAPHLKPYLDSYPQIRLELNLTDTLVDMFAEQIDVAIRITSTPDPRLIAHRLAPIHRVICATPKYITEHGEPGSLRELENHHVLAAHSQIPWHLEGPQGSVVVHSKSIIQTNSNEVVRAALLADVGIALRSTWDVGDELRRKTLKVVLPGYTGATDTALYAVHPGTTLESMKINSFVSFLADLYKDVPYWDHGLDHGGRASRTRSSAARKRKSA